ncbi:MAG: undecaprenyl-diphosphate phosphatase [Oscillospiraceae bacterium]|jgi:undecaprenyl-diphosphatase|nr:undecaprenyl-diphosphate phosphatase [Oscillospiraceae bacterium]
MLNLIKALIIGIVEGITEWLPISSTGHMILLDEVLKLDVSAAFREMFLVVIQLGAALAVVVLYFKRLFPIVRSTRTERRTAVTLWGKILVSCVPAAIVGLAFDDKIDALFFNAPTVAAALAVYGVIFILLERGRKSAPTITSTGEITYKIALLIGAFQLLALIPGTSRSGATIIGAMLLGTSRETAAEYTFFLAVPVMAGAGLLKLVKFGFAFAGGELAVLAVGFVTAFIVSVFAIRFLVSFVKRHTFVGFGVYRILLAIAVFVLLVLD